MSKLTDYSERKALLVLRSDVERLRLRMAVLQVRTIIAPPVSPDRTAWAAPLVGALLAFTVPLVGSGKLARIVRTLSFVVTAYRVVRSWQGTHASE
jgi:hypothetical protein